MKKKLNIESVTNELSHGSVFFQGPRRQRPVEPADGEVQGDAPDDQTAVNTVSQKTVKPENRKTREAAGGAPVPLLPATVSHATGTEFDLEHDVTHKDTVWLSEEEEDALEDLKRQFRRQYDLKAPKLDLMRCAIYALIQDFREHGEQSIVFRQISKKRRG